MAKVAKKAWLWPYLPSFTRPHFPGKPGQKPGKPGLARLFQAGRVFSWAPDARVALTTARAGLATQAVGAFVKVKIWEDLQ